MTQTRLCREKPLTLISDPPWEPDQVPRKRLDPVRRRRLHPELPVHQLLPPARLHPGLGEAYARAEPGREGRDRADPDQLRMAAEGHPRSARTPASRSSSQGGHERAVGCEDERPEMIDEGVRRAYNHPDNKLRASVLLDPPARQNSATTPGGGAYRGRQGDEVEVICAAKGGGSENKTKIVMLNPSDSIVDCAGDRPDHGRRLVSARASSASASAARPKRRCCWPKESLMEPVDIHELRRRRGATLSASKNCALELYEKVNALGIGAGPGRPHHRARRQDHGLSDPRRPCRSR